MGYSRVNISGQYTGYIRSDKLIRDSSDAYRSWEAVANGAGYINVRTGPGTSNSLLTNYPRLNNGARFTVIGEVHCPADGYVWYHILIVGTYEGYVRSDLTLPAASAPDNSGYQTWTGIVNGAGFVNVRTGPGTEYPQLSECPSLNNGVLVTVTGEVTGSDGSPWCTVTVPSGYAGYMKKSLLLVSSPGVTEEGKPVIPEHYEKWIGEIRAEVKGGYIYVYEQPTYASDYIGNSPKVNDGELVQVVGRYTNEGQNWYGIIISNRYFGYVLERYVDKLSERTMAAKLKATEIYNCFKGLPDYQSTSFSFETPLFKVDLGILCIELSVQHSYTPPEQDKIIFTKELSINTGKFSDSSFEVNWGSLVAEFKKINVDADFINFGELKGVIGDGSMTIEVKYDPVAAEIEIALLIQVLSNGLEDLTYVLTFTLRNSEGFDPAAMAYSDVWEILNKGLASDVPWETVVAIILAIILFILILLSLVRSGVIPENLIQEFKKCINTAFPSLGIA